MHRRSRYIAAAALLVASIGLACAREAPAPAPAATPAAAQPKRISPHEQASGTIDGTRVTVTYGRPSKRGRAIFGALVRYGEVWCPGADEATTIASDRPLQFGDLRVPAGTHTIWMLPAEDRWTLIVSSEASGFHTDYHPAADLGRVEMQRHTVAPVVEQLTFAVGPNGSGAGGTLTMTWDTTAVSASFTMGQ
jgi:hypothetical protein